ncbi:MAG: hypothetical protein ABSE79_23075 [Terriglobia bacterium]|jgi:uncharacterized membrane protein
MLTNYFYWHYLFWGQLTGIVFLIVGLISVRKQLSFRPDDWPVLGRVFVAAPLVLFGAGHLVGAQFLVSLVPAWMPWRLFWVYFVGLAEIAASASMVAMKHVRLSATLLGIMFFIFVLTIHLHDVLRTPYDRFRWAVMLRDLVFGIGAWALAGAQMEEDHVHGARGWIASCRTVFGVVLVFYAVEHFMHPKFALGVPLELPTPAWVPLPTLWGYVVGAMLLVSGVSILINKHARAAATWLGLAVTLVVVFYYLPMIVPAKLPSQLNTAVDYIADTLLFAGSIFLLAGAIPAAPSLSSLPLKPRTDHTEGLRELRA